MGLWSDIKYTTQGICPTGWHIPTDKEWKTLIPYVGGEEHAGGKLKEKGFTHWLPPNTGVTDEFGFNALPGGATSREDFPDTNPANTKIVDIGIRAWFMESNWIPLPTDPYPYVSAPIMYYGADVFDTGIGWLPLYQGGSVRCIKNPPKK
jgi:uncharacterized protein (TIGR02145 family)